MERPSFSYGAAYADLNNDGKLDVVVNNIDAPAFIYQNIGPSPSDEGHHSLQVRLQGESANRRGIGSTLILTAGGKKQHIYYSPYRGYMSTMEDRAQFGLGRASRVDSLEVIWPDGRYQVLTNLPADRLLVVKQADATERKPADRASVLSPTHDRVFQPLDPSQGLAYKHRRDRSWTTPCSRCCRT